MYKIKDMPSNERPRERLLNYGAKSLSTYELIAIILRIGYQNLSAIDLAKNIVNQLKDISELRTRSVHELTKIKGVGKTKAISLLAAIELVERVLKSNSENPTIQTPKDVYELLKYELKDLKQEVLIVLYLDAKSSLIEKKQLFKGTLNSSTIHPREIFKYAVKYSAYAIILVHNHPSGNPEPSIHDIEVTERIVEIGKLLQIQVLDHIIIANDKYNSIFEIIKK